MVLTGTMSRGPPPHFAGDPPFLEVLEEEAEEEEMGVQPRNLPIPVTGSSSSSQLIDCEFANPAGLGQQLHLARQRQWESHPLAARTSCCNSLAGPPAGRHIDILTRTDLGPCAITFRRLACGIGLSVFEFLMCR
ncbi:hypothetical protein HPP92_023578 [Vanilla planifolia]|uniref:Uncharacterized protein n=1 Tax=Vanilla planifolia TaxID=51239 RepID=A0A835PQL3_VANPL|nr:hypothetical protein HPP92_023578 [Vanilla planifolia]